MPFQSEKQRKYLWANEPAIAREWTDKYGSRVKKQEGGVSATWFPAFNNKSINIDPYIYPEAHGKKYETRHQWAKNTPQYHRDITENYFDELSKNWSQIPYIGKPAAAAIELAAPVGTGVMSLPYDTYSAFKKFGENPEKYADPGKWSKINAYFPDLADTNVAGILSALDREDMFSALGNRFVGAARPLANRIQSGWDAIKNEFGGSAEAADLSGMIPKNLEKTIEEGMQSYKKSNEISPALRKAIEEGTSYNEWDRIPNEKYHGLPIQRISLNQDEDDPYALTERLMRRGDFRPSSSYPSYNAWQMRAAQAPGLKRNIGRVMDFLRGPGTRLTPAQQRANQNYMTQHRITRNPQTGRMQGGLFAGQNAPGTSYFGSKTFQEMANKNIQKWGKTAPQAKVDAWKAVVTGGRDPSQGSSYTGHGKSGMGRDKSQLMAQGGLASLWQR